MQNKQPRILHIITKLAVGGAQLNTLISTRDITELGFDSVILTGPEKPSEGDLFSLAEKWNLKVLIAPHLRRSISPIVDFLAFFEIRKVIRDGNFDIVHTHGSKARFLGRLAASFFPSVRIAQTAHGWPFYDSMNPLHKILYVALEKLGFSLAHINICVSPRDRDKAIRHKLGHFDDYRIIRSGVEFSEFKAVRGGMAEARRKLGLSESAHIIGSVMRFCPEKAPDIFVRVAARVIQTRPDAIFVIAGDGPLRKQTETLIDSLNIRESFVLLGSRKDIVEILPAFDIFLITSRTEGLPRALLESLAAGVPVVSTDVGGIHELVGNGRNGLLSKEGDIQSLVNGINSILDNPGSVNQLMAHVDEDLVPFSAEKMVEDLYTLYSRMLSPSMNVVFLCDNEPFNIPKAVSRIIKKQPFNSYTLIPLKGHGSLKKPVRNIRRYISLYGFLGFFPQLFRFVCLKLSGILMLPTRYPHSLRQTARREHAAYATLDSINTAESREFLQSLDPDVFISIACPQILTKRTLAIPRSGAWNLHSALLPINRGMLPTFWSLYHGDKCGVTLHKMVPRLDAGEILLQREIDATINDCSLHQLLTRSKYLAAEVASDGLALIESGDYTLKPNPPEKATTNSFPQREDVKRFRTIGGKITGIRKARSDIAISFDVEEWFQTQATRKWYPDSKWDKMEGRVNSILEMILQILDEHNSKATFFFLGWIVERYPEIVHRIISKGHEVGYHGYSHKELTSLTREEFSRNTDRFFRLIDSLSLPAPVGFRAPSFSMKRDTSWAVDEIVGRGFIYDSSVYPMFKMRYGIPDAPRKPFRLKGRDLTILELPLASFPFFRTKLPVAGGAYLRFYPGLLHRMLLGSISRSGIIPVLYFHPWEIDSMNISGKMNFFQRVRQHHNSGQNTITKLRSILKTYRGITLRELSEKVELDDLNDFEL